MCGAAAQRRLGCTRISTSSQIQQHQRAIGVLRLDAAVSDARTRLAILRQEGCLRACFPSSGDVLQAVLLNTAGGITDGDVLRTSIAGQPGARMVVATAAAERIYKARIGAAPAQVTVCIDAGDASRIAYLPQETILFDGSALDRHLRIALAADAAYLGIETLVFGRAESGERLRDIRLRDRIELRRGNRLVFFDAVHMQGPVAQLLQSGACAAGAGAIAGLVFAGPDAAWRLAELREAIADEDVAFGASVRDDLLMGRIAGRDSQCVRQAILMAFSVLGQDWPLPAVWRC